MLPIWENIPLVPLQVSFNYCPKTEVVMWPARQFLLAFCN